MMDFDSIKEEQNEIDSINNSSRRFYPTSESQRGNNYQKTKVSQQNTPQQKANTIRKQNQQQQQQQQHQIREDIKKKEIARPDYSEPQLNSQSQSRSLGPTISDGYEYSDKGTIDPQRFTPQSKNNNYEFERQLMSLNQQLVLQNQGYKLRKDSIDSLQKKKQQIQILKMQESENHSLEVGVASSNKNVSLGSIQQRLSDQIYWPVSPSSESGGIIQSLSHQLNQQSASILKHQHYQFYNNNIIQNNFTRTSPYQLQQQQQFNSLKHKNLNGSNKGSRNEQRQSFDKKSSNKLNHKGGINATALRKRFSENLNIPNNNNSENYHSENAIQFETPVAPKHIYLNLEVLSPQKKSFSSRNEQISNQEQAPKQSQMPLQIIDENKRKVIEQLFKSKNTYIELRSGKTQHQIMQQVRQQINEEQENYQLLQQQQNQEQQQQQQLQQYSQQQSEQNNNSSLQQEEQFNNHREQYNSGSSQQQQYQNQQQKIPYQDIDRDAEQINENQNQQSQQQYNSLSSSNQQFQVEESLSLQHQSFPQNNVINEQVAQQYYSNQTQDSKVDKQRQSSSSISRVPQFVSFDSLVSSAKERASLNFIKTSNKTLEIRTKDCSFSSRKSATPKSCSVVGSRRNHQQSVSLSNYQRDSFNGSPKIKIADTNFFQKETLERNDFWIQTTKSHKKLLDQHYTDEAMKECSFSPMLYASNFQKRSRVNHLNQHSSVTNSLNPEFHKLAAISKGSYSKLYAFKKQMGYVSLKSNRS